MRPLLAILDRPEKVLLLRDVRWVVLGVTPEYPDTTQLGGMDLEPHVRSSAPITLHPRGCHNVSLLFASTGVWWPPRTWAGLTAW